MTLLVDLHTVSLFFMTSLGPLMRNYLLSLLAHIELPLKYYSKGCVGKLMLDQYTVNCKTGIPVKTNHKLWPMYTRNQEI